MDSETLKTCTGCSETQPLDDYNRQKAGLHGRAAACKTCRREYGREQYAANRESVLEQHRTWREENPDYMSRYREANPGAHWVSHYRRKSLAAGFTPVIENFTQEDLMERYGDACAHCGGPFEHLDHFPVAVALGGHHTLANVRPSCAACNQTQAKAIALQRAANPPQ